jgi:transcriptional regulator with XRE-family HTH domain
MRRLGAYLRGIRELRGLSQDEAARRIFGQPGRAETNKQSTLARIELGRVAVRPELLRTFSEVYREPLDRLAVAFATIMIFDKEVPAFLNEKTRRIGSLWASADHSFDTSLPDENAFFSNAVEIWSFQDIARWERELASRFSGRPDLALWVVSPTFVDHKSAEFLAIVVDCLILDGVELTYFVAERDLVPGECFDTFLDRVTFRLRDHRNQKFEGASREVDPKKLGKIRVFGLSADDLAWFTSSLVIANPDGIQSGRTDAEGFAIVPVEGEHAFGIPLPRSELAGIVNRITRQIEKRERDPDAPGTWHPDALSTYPRFMREFGNA